MSEYVLETKDLVRIFNQGKDNEAKILCGMDIKIKEGEFTTITGPSGSGKSTLLNILGCLDRPTSGKMYFRGKDISKLSDEELTRIRRDNIGFVFQQFNLIQSLSCLENVELALRISGKSINESKKRATELLKSVGLGNRINNVPAQLSGGEMQRVAVARALANKPKLILADEPTGNLDSKTSQEIIKIMKDLNEEGYTFVIITHDLNIARESKRNINIKDGKIV